MFQTLFSQRSRQFRIVISAIQNITHKRVVRVYSDFLMTIPLFLGCLFVSFGPLMAIFCTLIARNDQMVILTAGSSFFWLLSVMITSVIWYVIPPMHGVYAASIFTAVIIQEVFRYVFYRLYVKAEKILKPRTGEISVSSISNRLYVSFAVGVGIAIIYNCLMYQSLLWDTMGPATLFSASCPTVDLFIVNGLMALMFSIMNICQSIIAFDAYRQLKSRRGMAELAFVILTHFVASFSSLANTSGGSCIAGLILTLVLTMVTTAACIFLVKTQYLDSNLR